MKPLTVAVSRLPYLITFLVTALLFVSHPAFAVTDGPDIYPDLDNGIGHWTPPVFTGDKSMPIYFVLEKLGRPSAYLMPEDIALDFAFPEIEHPRVEFFIDFFCTSCRHNFQRWLDRMVYYGPPIQDILREEGMPHDMIYLAMIESGFNPYAVSRAGAGGIWQFIPGTGRRYGLEVNFWMDERFDPEKSTRAAVRYLKDLYSMFGCWHLAAASYNCGEARVARLIAKYDLKNYWDLRNEDGLMQETKDYLPKIIAAAIIARNPERFGFNRGEYQEPFTYDTVKINGPLDLRLAASLAGTSYPSLKDLNPELLHWCTPPELRTYTLHIPRGKTNEFNKALAGLPAEQRTIAFRKHTVNSGESLDQLAAGYEINRSMILSMNHLKSKSLKEGQVLTLPVPADQEPNRAAMARIAKLESKGKGKSYPLNPPSEKEMAQKGLKQVSYTIKPGDNLGAISQKTGVPVDYIQRWNGIKNPKTLQAGHTLHLYVPSGKAPSLPVEEPEKEIAKAAKAEPSPAPARSAATKPREASYTIKQGDCLWSIAQANSLSVDELCRLNNITPKAKLKVGTSLKVCGSPGSAKAEQPKQTVARLEPVKQSPVPTPVSTSSPSRGKSTPGTISYKVKKNDTLWSIANQYKVDVNDIQDWNKLSKNAVLHPGDKIIIKVSSND